MDSKLDIAIKKAFINNCDEDELDRMNDAIVEALGDDYEPESPIELSVRKRIFLELPMNVVGMFVSWGGNDTGVGDAIFEFTEENKPKILKIIAEG